MNRYVKRGLLDDAAQGKRVLYVAHSYRQMEDAVHQLARDAEGCKVRMGHGYERIDHPSGGSISFAAPLDACRGKEADVVYDERSAPIEMLAPCLAAGGELLRA